MFIIILLYAIEMPHGYIPFTEHVLLPSVIIAYSWFIAALKSIKWFQAYGNRKKVAAPKAELSGVSTCQSLYRNKLRAVWNNWGNYTAYPNINHTRTYCSRAAITKMLWQGGVFIVYFHTFRKNETKFYLHLFLSAVTVYFMYLQKQGSFFYSNDIMINIMLNSFK